MSKPIIEPETLVTWTSGAQGTMKTKTGTVLAFIPKRESLANIYPEILDLPRSAVKFDNIKFSSLHDRYLVKVPRLKKNGELSGKVDYYTPRSTGIEIAT